ncbi:MAG: hypothetical protein ABIJ47_06930 [Candidatus Bathyarchaeota archaeon]
MALRSGDKVTVACCPRCQGVRVWKDGFRKEGLKPVQRYVCRDCGFRFSDSPKLKVEFIVTGEALEGPHADEDLPHNVVTCPDLPLKEAHDGIQNNMRITLNRLGLGLWSARWLPDSTKRIRGKADPETMSIEVYDVNEAEAWGTFVHEVVEIKMRSALRPYRVLVNKLIEGYQEIADHEKDSFIESLMDVFDAVHESPPSS